MQQSQHIYLHGDGCTQRGGWRWGWGWTMGLADVSGGDNATLMRGDIRILRL